MQEPHTPDREVEFWTGATANNSKRLSNLRLSVASTFPEKIRNNPIFNTTEISSPTKKRSLRPQKLLDLIDKNFPDDNSIKDLLKDNKQEEYAENGRETDLQIDNNVKINSPINLSHSLSIADKINARYRNNPGAIPIPPTDGSGDSKRLNNEATVYERKEELETILSIVSDLSENQILLFNRLEDKLDHLGEKISFHTQLRYEANHLSVVPYRENKPLRMLVSRKVPQENSRSFLPYFLTTCCILAPVITLALDQIL